ncbi:MAG: efflux RND transporter periplasmic adaptor subunit [Blastopirellula sp. JB062]
MSFPKILRYVFVAIALLAMGASAYLTQEYWLSSLASVQDEAAPADETEAPVEEPKVLKLSKQARMNLNLVAKPVRAQDYWRTLPIPAIIADRPGETDRGVTSPAVGVVTEIFAYPGQTVRPGEKLFTIRLSSEYLQNTQKELFTATQEQQLAQEQIDRLLPLANSGAVSGSRIIDLKSQVRRQEALIQSHRQDLLARGMAPSQVDKVANGEFVTVVTVTAPPAKSTTHPVADGVLAAQAEPFDQHETAYEVQSLETDLGKQVQAGQILSTLANHRNLYIEGHAFKREAPFLEDAAQNDWEITVEFAEDHPDHWPNLEQKFTIEYLSNAVDADSRTFDFYIPLTNQARFYEKKDETFVVWRFRPGQRVRLHVPVEQFQDVLVVPSGAVVREGPEAYVFQQNGDLFNRLSVRVLHEDRLNVILADDGSVTPGLYLAQNGAASLNRVLKAQAASGVRADVHVHADGTVHASH